MHPLGFTPLYPLLKASVYIYIYMHSYYYYYKRVKMRDLTVCNSVCGMGWLCKRLLDRFDASFFELSLHVVQSRS